MQKLYMYSIIKSYCVYGRTEYILSNKDRICKDNNNKYYVGRLNDKTDSQPCYFPIIDYQTNTIIGFTDSYIFI